ncbi:unnamed protein product [Caenorhabditis bovis]|uniref:DUF7064 domain-containing protein n=1 Tax=Caenorhabditis bovis TaxID=2654633 RepID=A0A8S1EP77_9PELO|nr:unnamed protein product [Caenorhabditis bovis]
MFSITIPYNNRYHQYSAITILRYLCLKMLLLAIPLLIIFPYLVHFALRPDPVKIAGIYSVRGTWYHLKFYLMRFIIARRQKKQKSVESENLMNSQFGGDGGERNIEKMETKHELPKDFAADAVFFDASNSDGWYFTLGTAQRPNDIINLFFILRIPNVGTLVNEELLTNTNSINVSNKEWRTASGFVVTCIKPMEEWRVQFKGQLTKSPGRRIFAKIGVDPLPENLERIDAEFDLKWTNHGDYFDFDKMVSPTAIAHSLAIEPWSRQLFEKMRASHQTHYEQFGYLKGTYRIGEKKFDNIRMTSMRDHTIAGYRRWKDIRRYIMMIYHLEDGTCIHTSVISMPEVVFSHLEFGYIVTPSGETKPVDRVHFSLYNHGEDKKFPEKFHYSFDVGSEKYEVDVFLKDVVSFKMGLDLACQVNEGMAEFVVDGNRKGWGFAEVEYRIDPY